MSAFDAIVEAAERVADCPLPPLVATAELNAQAKPQHKEAARQIAFALGHGGAGDFMACGAALRHLLDAKEAFGLALAALGAIEEEDFPALVDVLFEPGFGDPFPRSANRTRLLEDADWWAQCATRREREAYALASLLRMPRSDREALLRAVSGDGT